MSCSATTPIPIRWLSPPGFLSGWGLKFVDFDVDGDMDLFLANGHPDDMIASYSLQVTYAMPLLLFENVDGRFRDISERAGAVFAEKYPARGMTAGDIDNDGRVDVLVANNGQAPVLLRNQMGGRQPLDRFEAGGQDR